MEAYHIVAISIGIVMATFSLVTLVSFFYCIYMMCHLPINEAGNDVGNDTIKTFKSTAYSRQTTRMISEDENRRSKLPSTTSIV